MDEQAGLSFGPCARCGGSVIGSGVHVQRRHADENRGYVVLGPETDVYHHGCVPPIEDVQ